MSIHTCNLDEVGAAIDILEHEGNVIDSVTRGEQTAMVVYHDDCDCYYGWEPACDNDPALQARLAAITY